MVTAAGRIPTFASGAVLLALSILIASPAGAASPSPAPSMPTESPTGSAIASPKADADADDLLVDDLFTASPDPLTLTPVLATRRAASKVIGPKGGTIKARGVDGTRYTLKVPGEALPMGMTITMTPLEDVGGFLEGTEPKHVLGVQLEPDGLPLAAPATLMIQPKKRLPVELAALDYEGEGAEAGFHVFEADARRITIPVEHFSGHIVTFPTLADEIRFTAERHRTDPASELRSMVAAILGIERQRQLLHGEVVDETGEVVPPLDLREVAQSVLPTFVEIVLLPRVAVASQGCAQAEAAIAALLAYERQRQLLGVGDDPEFDLATGPSGAASELVRLPARLVDLRVRLCFREAHAWCVRTGDFPGMAAYFLSAFKQSDVSLGQAPTAEQIELAHGYLRRCGRYRAELAFDSPDRSGDDFERRERFRLDIELEWRPGDGSYGIVGSTIEGEGEHEDIDFAFASAGCTRRGTNVANARTGDPGRARIELLAVEYLGERGEALPVPRPRTLELLLGLGTVRYDYRCTGKRETQEYVIPLAIFGQLDAPATRELGSGALRIKGRWAFSTEPFKATWEFREAFPQAQGGLTLNLDVSVLHEPT